MDATRPDDPRRAPPTAAAALVAVACFATLAVVSTIPAKTALEHFVADDYFYELVIARHVAAGDGATFDGVHPTNGFHPLFVGACVVLAKLVSDPFLLMRCGLAALAVAYFAAAWTATRFVARTVGAGTSLVCAAAFCNPLFVGVVLGGHETAVALLALFWAFAATGRALAAPGVGRAAAAGAVAGLACLGRMDALLWLPFGAAALVLVGTPTTRGARIARGAAFVAAAALVVGPFLAWGLAKTGDALPGSLAALRLWKFHPLTAQRLSSEGFGAVGERLANAADWSDRFAAGWGLWPALRGPKAWCVPAALAAVVVAARGAWTIRRAAPLAPWCAAYLAVHGAWYVLEADPTPRYLFAQIVLVPTAFVVGADAAAWPRILRRTAAAAVVGVVLFAASDAWRTCGSLFNEWHGLHGALWDDVPRLVEQYVPQGRRFGAFNAGILAYRTHREVVDLDGVVNNSARRALEEKRLRDYLRDERIEYFGDWSDDQIRMFLTLGGWTTWHDDADVVVTAWHGDDQGHGVTYRLLHVRPSEAAPR